MTNAAAASFHHQLSALTCVFFHEIVVQVTGNNKKLQYTSTMFQHCCRPLHLPLYDHDKTTTKWCSSMSMQCECDVNKTAREWFHTAIGSMILIGGPMLQSSQARLPLLVLLIRILLAHEEICQCHELLWTKRNCDYCCSHTQQEHEESY